MAIERKRNRQESPTIKKTTKNFKEAVGDSGNEKLPVNRKKLPAEQGSGHLP